MSKLLIRVLEYLLRVVGSAVHKKKKIPTRVGTGGAPQLVEKNSGKTQLVEIPKKTG